MFLEEGRVLEAKRVSRGRGRKRVLVRLNERFRYVAVVEFDENTVTVGITDLRPQIVTMVSEPADLGHGADGLVSQLVSCTRSALRKAGVENSLLIGLGIADPGLVDSRRGVTVMSSTISFWKQVPLKEIFAKEFGIAVVVESRTRAKAYAECILGAGGMADNMIYIDYGVGIGAGIIVNQKLIYGQNCAAGEFGHTHILGDGPACNCGSFGCLEALVGARAVEMRVRKAIAEGGYTRALQNAGGDPERLTVWTVLEEASRSDKICSNIVAEMGAYLGLGVANLVNLFNPSVVVLDSRLSIGGKALLGQISDVMKRQALTYSSERVSLRFGVIGPEVGVLGTALIVIENHLAASALRPPLFMRSGAAGLETAL